MSVLVLVLDFLVCNTSPLPFMQVSLLKNRVNIASGTPSRLIIIVFFGALYIYFFLRFIFLTVQYKGVPDLIAHGKLAS